MPRIAYVNGQYVPHARARVHVEDRGFQFADSVYEVCAIRTGQLIDEAPHLLRLARSLDALRIRQPLADASLRHLMREVARRNKVSDGLVYVQVSRGVATRDHAFPSPDVVPTLIITARTLDLAKYESLARVGVSVVLLPDARWARCDIKSTGLLANVLAKQQARLSGAYEAWFVDGRGFVTEGASTNAWIVDSTGTLRTRSLSNAILPGVTRGQILEICRAYSINIEETPFSAEEAMIAKEAFISAATMGLLPVTQIGAAKIGDGKPGQIGVRLRNLYWGNRIS